MLGAGTKMNVMQTISTKNHRLASARPNASVIMDGSVVPAQAVQLKRILVPVDFSGPSISALRYAARLAAQFGASILTAYVAEHVVYFDETVTFPGRDVLEEMKQKLTELARSEVREFVPTYPHVLKG